MTDILRIVFPALMVIGALGSLVTNIVTKETQPTVLQWIAICLQWMGASLLYTGLLIRNMR